VNKTEKGEVMEGLTVDLPYPSMDGIEKDLRTARLIEQAYAGVHSELTAILQYIYHVLYFEEEGKKDTAGTLLKIAIAEMRHVKILGELLIKLGGDPIYATRSIFDIRFFNAGYVTYSKTPKKMLLDDITSEMLAISEYDELIKKTESEKVAAVLARIRLDEELHVTALKKELKELS